VPDHAGIDASYPVVWREPPGPSYAGSLSLGPGSLTLDGTAAGSREVVLLSFTDLASVRMAGAGEKRLGARPTLVIQTREGRRFEIAAVAGLGVLREVADVLALEIAHS